MKMLSYTIVGLFIFAVEFSPLVVCYPGTVITINSAKVTNYPNDYFEPWTVDIIQGKKGSLLNAKLITKKQLPETMQFAISVIIDGELAVEYTTSLCIALVDEIIGKSFVASGMPKDQFPKQCPFLPGDWSILKFEPPTEKVPPGIPNGPISGSVILGEDGKEPCVKIDYEGTISNTLPGFGR